MNIDRGLIIIGAGGHGRVVSDIAKQTGYTEIVFLDDVLHPGVTGKVSEYRKYLARGDFFVAIGNSSVRKKIMQELQSEGANLISLVHPASIVAPKVKIGTGTVIMAGAVVNTDTVIGDGVIINTCASVDHDCIVEDYVHVAVGAHICGTVSVGESTWIGAGATIINNICICTECQIGAGAVVIRDINAPGVYVGVPARKVK